MGKLERALRDKLKKRPQDTVRLIVRVKGDMSRARARLAELGVTVLRSFNLIKAIAISCPGKTALALQKEPWVQAIEEDRRVSTQ